MTVIASELPTLEVQVRAIRLEARAIRSFELVASGGSPLPAAQPGAHIDIVLPDGGERSYSLVEFSPDGALYLVAVQREAESRGGSAFLCDTVRVGDLLRIKPPINNFPLAETAELSVLVAGGIGLTPILSMIRRLDQLGLAWVLFFAARSRAEAPFLDVLAALEARAPGRVYLRFGDEAGDRFDLAAILSQAPGTHFYCCGPARMLKAFEEAALHVPPDHVHVEYFVADAPVAAGGFEVVLARSGRSVWIPRDKTILETLLAEGMSVPRSCMEGVCGTCETVVLEGVPDHRDQVLSPRERRSNRKMIICRSGCIGDRLVLDL